MKADLDLFNEFWLLTEREEKFGLFREHVRRARPFSLSAEVDEMVGEFAYAVIDDKRTARHLASARLPYPVMWIEHPNTGFSRRTPLDIFQHPTRTGWLLEEQYHVDAPEGRPVGFRATRISRVEDDEGELHARLFPVIHTVMIDHPVDYADLKARAMASCANIPGTAEARVVEAFWSLMELPATSMLGWGGGDAMIPPEAGEEVADSLLRRSPLFGHAMWELTDEFILESMGSQFDPVSGVIDEARRVMLEHISELRYLVAALSLLNEMPVEYVKYTPYRPEGSVRMGGRMRPFMSSSVVSLTVPNTRRRLKEFDRLLQKRGREEMRKKARHEVRGHFRHVKKLPKAHPERWERWQDVDGRFGATGAWWWRTYIEHHVRGSAELGWVDQKYAVVTKHPGENRLTGDDLSDRG